jgi:hypothetical protein
MRSSVNDSGDLSTLHPTLSVEHRRRDVAVEVGPESEAGHLLDDERQTNQAFTNWMGLRGPGYHSNRSIGCGRRKLRQA